MSERQKMLKRLIKGFKDCKVSQYQIADAAKRSQPFISKFLNGAPDAYLESFLPQYLIKCRAEHNAKYKPINNELEKAGFHEE